jgi:ketosteroid isomerase-like protein
MNGTSDGGDPVPAWATTTGHVCVGPVAQDDPATALDRLLIAERIARYGWAYDERDRAALADCFTDHAVWEGSVMGREAVGPFSGRQAIAGFLAGFWPAQPDQRRHLFSNVVVTGHTGDTVTAHAYLLLASTYDAVLRPVSTGPYRFSLERDAGTWRISRLSAGFDAPF